MRYNPQEIEPKWQKYWQENQTYKTSIDKNKPKFYVLDMFPYPSGAGLHVGHPLGYIASDIYTRYKRLKGFNTLHPMGYDAYGLPAEQYAIQTGQHPAITTENNIKQYRRQLDKLGFSFDWDRQVKTCEPQYYKWTQWVFIQMYRHYYDTKEQKAQPIAKLVKHFEAQGTKELNAASTQILNFSSSEWLAKTEKEKQLALMNYRLAYQDETMVNWCPELGTVLANDEVKEGLSVRGGHPVEQKKMKQWFLRVSAYAQRLLDGMDVLEWTDSLKEVQRNWIGRSQGAEIDFLIKGHKKPMSVFTTRPDTIYGVTFMVLAPESEWVELLARNEYKTSVANYLKATQKKTERERLSNVKTVSGQFTGSYAINPFTEKEIPIYISDYVLSGYGTGAIMAVPAHDSRDYTFAKHFNLPIVEVITGGNIEEEAYEAKEVGTLVNSGIINGMDPKKAIQTIGQEVEKRKIGNTKTNYRLRDAIFSRQRYWGEPFPIYYKDEVPYTLPEDELPIQLPEIDKYLPTETGEPPLGRAKNWTYEGYSIDLNTMPGFAGSSAYYLRYMDPQNNKALVSKEANEYWQDIDLYVGGTEHATGHLIYSRFWNKFLYDIGKVIKDEPFKKLINQGMIQGRSNFVYRIKNSNQFVSYGLRKKYDTTAIHVDVNIVHNDVLDTEAFRKWRPEFKDAEFILEEGKYHCGYAVEKMSKSMFNVVNPDDIVKQYGADTLRLYEMFLGPIEQSKPWDTNGIDGVHKFLNKLWRLFFDKTGKMTISKEPPTDIENKILHKTIKKVQEDIERFSFNTSVSAFMICVNELTEQKCNKKKVLEQLLILLSPFAPHITQELWQLLGNKKLVVNANFPQYDKKYLVEDTHKYPVSFNGKMRFKMELPLNLAQPEIENLLLQNDETRKWLQGKTPKKIIYIAGRIINIVV